MYPKKHPINSKKREETKNSNSKADREALKKMVTQTLHQKFSEKPSNQIKEEVEKTMKSKKLSGESLKTLERKISELPTIEKPNLNQDTLSVHSEYSKMSGATNFDKISKTKGNNVESLSKSNQPLFEAKRKESQGLNVENEKDEWAMIYKYNTFLSQKEGMAEKIKQKENKKLFASELEKQIKEKEILSQKEKEIERGFHDVMLLNCDRFDKEKQLENENKRLQIKREKDERDLQLKDIKARRRYEDKQEKALDKFIIAKLQEDMEDERQFLAQKKAHQAKIMEKMMADSEKQRIVNLQNEEKNRQETIALQEAYCRLLDEQDRQRDQMLKEREERSKKFVEAALDTKSSEYQKIVVAMENRANRYKNRLEKKLDEEEKRKSEHNWNQKLQMRKVLNKQMEEKKERQVKEKESDMEQAMMWKSDTEGFFAFEKEKEGKKKSTLKAYNKELIDQMNEKEKEKVKAKVMIGELDSMLKNKLEEEKEFYNSLQVK